MKNIKKNILLIVLLLCIALSVIATAYSSLIKSDFAVLEVE